MTKVPERYDMRMNNTTHYNLIDTFNHVMGREKFSAMYHEFVKDFLKPMQAKSWNGSVNMHDVAAVYSEAKDMTFPVACTFADCFMWINETDLHKNGGDGYGIDD